MEKATQVSHCLAPARARAATIGAVTSTTYARMFPELPPFEADEAFLHAALHQNVSAHLKASGTALP